MYIYIYISTLEREYKYTYMVQLRGGMNRPGTHNEGCFRPGSLEAELLVALEMFLGLAIFSFV